MKLQIENLSFRYARRGPMVLQDVNLSFETGEVVGLLGPNGAGKSTLLYLIAGALTPNYGLVNYDGVSTRFRRPSVLSDIYLVAEESQLPRMSLQSYVEYFSAFYPDFNREIMDMALKEFEMGGSVRHLDSISMGQKKKILLSFAFACDTPVVLLDEPTNGLDIPGKAAFRRLVARLASDDRLFLISTHQVRDLDTILDRVLIMNNRQFLVDATMPLLQEKFRFVSGAPASASDALCSLPSPGGFDYVAENHSGEETDVNLELLFEASLKHADKINDILAR